MKKYLSLTPLFALMLAAFYFTGCKKCYHCHNECYLCTKPHQVVDTFVTVDTLRRNDTITGFKTVIVIDTVIKIDTIYDCTDNFKTDADYYKTIANDSLGGYNCRPTNPTYNHDFCVNKPGEENYPNYYNEGGRAKCDPK